MTHARKLALLFVLTLTATAAWAQSYQTNFPANENPISQGGNWVNGLTTGVHWGDISTSGGIAHGTNNSPGCPGTPNACNDSHAALTAAWSANQSACATVFLSSSLNRTNFYEYEIHLHRAITAGNSKGYEFNYSSKNDGGQYMQIVRWDGYTGGNQSFTALSTTQTPGGTPPALANGDTFCASAIGSTLTSWVVRNTTLLVKTVATDSTYSGGAPGIGLYNNFYPLTDNALFGFSSFLATNYTALTANQADLAPLVNGPTHTAVNGETFQLPPGTLGWSAGITFPPNVGIQIFGSGTPNSSSICTNVTQVGCGAGTPTTIITDNAGSSHMLVGTPTFGNALTRISGINIVPGATNQSAISINGTCTASGCPHVRIDNTVTTHWDNMGIPGSAYIYAANVFGVIDHNTGVNPNVTSGTNPTFVDIGHGHYLGVGGWGDNSWAQPSNFISDQNQIVLENNSLSGIVGTDSEIFDGVGNWGGARYTCRFNYFPQINENGACTGHGTDTTGRPRGARKFEGYGNFLVCADALRGCNSAWPGRSGVIRSAINTVTQSGGNFKGLGAATTDRRWRNTGIWGAGAGGVTGGPPHCGGNAPWDANDTNGGGGNTAHVYYTGVVGTVTDNGSGWVITDNGAPGWTVNQWAPLGANYSFVDVSRAPTAIAYELIGSNTANVLTLLENSNGGNGGTPIAGDTYTIQRAFVCLDQTGYSGGVLVRDTVPNSAIPVLNTTGLPGPVSQSIDPVYEADDSLQGANHTYSGDGAVIIPNRDVFSEAVNQVAQTSSTFPFSGVSIQQAVSSWSCNSSTCTWNIASSTGFAVNGYVNVFGTVAGVTNHRTNNNPYQITALTPTSVTASVPGVFPDTGGAGGVLLSIGAGHGTLANRPTCASCLTGVGYWATDQGTWNTISGGVQGQLYVWNGASWALNWVPLTYPHPDITGVQTGGTPAVSLAPGSVAFGSVLVGSTSPSTTVVLTNTGTGPLTINSIGLTGTNPTDFAQTNNCGAAVAAGGSCNIVVTCTPLSAASFSASVSVTDNAAGSPQTVPLTCTGTTASPAIQFAPTSIAFAARTVGTSSSPTGITVTNTGAANLVITSVGILGGNSTSFSQTNNCGTVVPAGTCTINVTFTPQIAGALASSVSVVDNAAGSPQSVPLTGTGNGVAAIGFNPTSLPFGNQTVGGTSAALSTTVTNTGTASLTLSSITLTGTNSGDFAISANTCGGSLAVNATCSVSVTFTPGATGARSANLTFADNAPASPQNVPLTGTGTQAGVSFSPASLSFGSQNVGSTSTPQSTTLTNTGSATLNIASITITGTNAADFVISSNTCGATLAAAGTCTVSVTFKPSIVGPESANLVFADNAPASPQTVPMSGVGVGTSISVTPSSLTFPSTVVGQTSATQQVTVTNTGGTTITFTSVVISGGNAGDFQISSSTCGSSLAPPLSCSVVVAFKPTLTGGRLSTLVFTDSAPNSPQNVALSGTGTQSGVQLSPATITFPATPVGTTSAAQTVTLTNTGTATLNISNISLAVTDTYFAISANTCGSTLGAGLNCTVSLTFTPQTFGNFTFTLSFTDDGPNSPQTVTGGGAGTFLALSFNPASLSFGSVNVGTTSAGQAITMANNGNGTVAISSITITGANPGDYSQTNNCPPNLAGGGSCTITVKFAPTTNGARAANIQVTDNAPGSPQTVALSGTGVTPTAGISLSPTSLTFASQGVGTSSASQPITVSNPGSGNLVITGISISGDYSQTNNCGTVVPLGSCTVNVTFSPTTTGTRVGILTLTDNAAGSPHTAPLSGTGTAAAVSFVPASLTFPNTAVSVASAALTTTLKNTGGASLTSVVISIVGANAGDYSQNNNCGSTVLAGGSCAINVTFTPTANGSRVANVQVVDNIGTQTVSLQGQGFTPAPLVSLSVASVVFGNQTTGTASNQRVVILTNTGTASLTISSTSITGTNAGDFGSTTTCGGSLAVNASCAYQFTFMPSAAGARSATFNLNTNAASSPDHVSLSGTGVTSPGGAQSPQVFGDD